MATWTTILNAEVAAGAPLTTALVTALRDNAQAVLEGDSTLPQFLAGGLLLLDSQEWSTGTTIVTFDPTALGDFNVFMIMGQFQSSGLATNTEIQVRQSAGTWRQVAVKQAATTSASAHFLGFVTNANNHQGGAVGSGAVVTGWLTLPVNGSYNRTNGTGSVATTDDVGSGFHSFNESVDEIRVDFNSSILGGLLGLYGVRSGSIEGTAS